MENSNKNIEKLIKSNGEVFQVISTEKEFLHLKGETTGFALKISMSDIFKAMEIGAIKLRRKPIPIVKIDGRKKSRSPISSPVQSTIDTGNKRENIPPLFETSNPD